MAMALNTIKVLNQFKCNCLTPLHFKGLIEYEIIIPDTLCVRV